MGLCAVFERYHNLKTIKQNKKREWLKHPLFERIAIIEQRWRDRGEMDIREEMIRRIKLWQKKRDEMKKLVFTVLLLLISLPLYAQTPVFIGPTTQLQWDVVAGDVPTAQGLIYSLSVDLGVVVPLTSVTCALSSPLVTGTQTCSVLLNPQIPLGTHSITLTATSGLLVSSPSAPFAYIDLLIPVPKNLRVK